MSAIIESPDDDSIRLIAADYLEEHGESERAEFIRVQCELARMPRCDRSHFNNQHAGGMCVDCQGHPLRVRERELMQFANGDWWVDDLSFPCGFSDSDISAWSIKAEWRRGFISKITLTCADWLTHREALLRACPLERVTLSEFTEIDSGNVAPPFSNKAYITTPVYPGFPGFPVTLRVRKGQLFDAAGKEVIVISPMEHAILFGNPYAPRPQGVIHTPR